ncbi:cytochrome c [Acetobacter sp. AN02]|uniref:c-type cytochrome n=1 Tax=Acetobacter sp. AN02 TaxID=2894186 RepID=UPI0024344D22|nr:cytochrome c [Acetobacter sp. AN02]MDG6095600.1 cytochrome c [Acetobacter sp. AN02]
MKRVVPVLAFLLSAPASFAADGASLYKTTCSVCHMADAAGMSGRFPPLKGRVDKIAAAPGGKTYLADVVINGLHGPITAAGDSYAGFMPPLRSMSDDQLASILTYIADLGDTKPSPVVNASDIAASRKGPKSADAIMAERKALEDAHVIR